MNSKNVLKCVLALALLLCLLKMPYWYYKLIRLCGMVGFFYFAYIDNKDKIKIFPILFTLAAIIINPIIKIPFGRNIWQIIDIILAAVLLFSIFFQRKLKNILQKPNQK
jgi:uncharacterized membrane protein YccC